MHVNKMQYRLSGQTKNPAAGLHATRNKQSTEHTLAHINATNYVFHLLCYTYQSINPVVKSGELKPQFIQEVTSCVHTCSLFVNYVFIKCMA